MVSTSDFESGDLGSIPSRSRYGYMLCIILSIYLFKAKKYIDNYMFSGFLKKNNNKSVSKDVGSNPFVSDIQLGVSPDVLDDIPEIIGCDDNDNKDGLFKGWFKGQRLNETYSHSLYETVQTFSSRWFPLATSTLTGHLTIEEFIQAGNYLVNINSNWEWSFNPDYMSPILPPDKQYLINRGLTVKGYLNDVYDRVHLDFEQNELWSCPNPEYKSFDKGHIYDISLTFDESTRTPRVWVFGYSSTGKPLTTEEMTPDICLEFIGTIATTIPHPITGLLNISIHPCRHAEGMGRIINKINKSGEQFQVEQYLIYFLQLIACVFPSMDIS